MKKVTMLLSLLIVYSSYSFSQEKHEKMTVRKTEKYPEQKSICYNCYFDITGKEWKLPCDTIKYYKEYKNTLKLISDGNSSSKHHFKNDKTSAKIIN